MNETGGRQLDDQQRTDYGGPARSARNGARLRRPGQLQRGSQCPLCAGRHVGGLRGRRDRSLRLGFLDAKSEHPDVSRHFQSVRRREDGGGVCLRQQGEPKSNRALRPAERSPGLLPSTSVRLPPDSRRYISPEDLALSPSGDLVYVMGGVASAYRLVAMFDTATGAMLWSGDWAIIPTFTPDGNTVYVRGNQGMDLQGFDARTGVQGLDAPVPGDVAGFGMMPDVNTLIALVGPECVPTPGPSLRVVDRVPLGRRRKRSPPIPAGREHDALWGRAPRPSGVQVLDGRRSLRGEPQPV